MESNKFVQNIANQFSDTEAFKVSIDTNFRDLKEWDSLSALLIIAMVDEFYNVKLTGDDIRKSNTVEDLYNIVKSKL